jgi:hypothetical protein
VRHHVRTTVGGSRWSRAQSAALVRSRTPICRNTRPRCGSGGPDRAQQLGRLAVLEQVADGAAGQRVVHAGTVRERREDDDPDPGRARDGVRTGAVCEKDALDSKPVVAGTTAAAASAA